MRCIACHDPQIRAVSVDDVQCLNTLSGMANIEQDA